LYPDRPQPISLPQTGKRRAIELGSAYIIIEQDLPPATFKEINAHPDKDQWIAACNSEYQSLMKNNTWELATLPPGRKAITCKWIFKIKHKADGSIDRYKARLVVRGFSQVAGVDYNETFAPVIRFESIRVLLAIVTALDLEFTTAT
jgi:hypothetical protein